MKAKELYEYRNILKSLVVKGLFGKYKYSHLGFLWHFITPIIYLVLSYVLYSELKEQSIDNYWIFLATGIFAFHLLTGAVSGGAGCFIHNASLIKKIYFPREIAVIAHATINLIIAIIGYVIVVSIMIILRYPFNLEAILLLPIMFTLIFIFSIGSMLLLSSLSVYVRDLMYLLSSTQIIFFVCTPIRFLASNTTGILEKCIWLNPFTYYIESFHQILYLHTIPNTSTLMICTALSIGSLIIGYLTFNKLKKGFAERL